MGAREVEAFLSHLASEGNVSASTHQQALSALLFLYKEVPGVNLPWLENLSRPKKPKRLPVVLTVTEVRKVLAQLEGTHALMARLASENYLASPPDRGGRIIVESVAGCAWTRWPNGRGIRRADPARR